MQFWQRAEEILSSILTAALLAVGTGVSWLIRRVLTNQAQIELLKTELEHRDKLRTEDRDALKEVRDGVKRIEGVLLKSGEAD